MLSTIKAIGGGFGESVELFHFNIHWPKGNVQHGESRLCLGFADSDLAKEWHRMLSGVLLKRYSGVLPGLTPTVSRDLPEESNVAQEASLSPGKAAAAANGVAKTAVKPTNPLLMSMTSTSTGLTGGLSGTLDEELDATVLGADELPHFLEKLPASRSRTAKWMPIGYTNGLPIYYCANGNPGAAGPRLGKTAGEYMVSCVIAGTPEECGVVLMTARSCASVLGPVTQIKLLERYGMGDKVMYMELEAGNAYGGWLAPRYAIIRQVAHSSEGTVVLHFSDEKERQLPQELQAAHQALPWHSRPTRMRVSGGLTVSPAMDGEKVGCSARTCLATYVLKVEDLGGSCSDLAWMRVPAAAAGAQKGLVEQLLMTVILLRDEVEHARFCVRPFDSYVIDEAEVAEDAEAEAQRPSRQQTTTSKLLDEAADRLASRTASGKVSVNVNGVANGVHSMSAGAKVTAASAMSAVKGAAQPPATSNGNAARDMSAAAAGGDALDAVPDESAPAEPFEIPPFDPLGTLQKRFWIPLHAEGAPSPFNLRGPNYLKDKAKIPGGVGQYTLSSVDLIKVDKPVEHIGRFLPTIRCNGAPFTVSFSILVPGNPLIYMVFSFTTDRHPDLLGEPPEEPNDEWTPFDYSMHRFLTSNDDGKSGMVKLIPRLSEGSWILKQSVGTTPVIMGRKLRQIYFRTDSYIEVDIDLAANTAANHITGVVRGAIRTVSLDFAFLLEAQRQKELPEKLIGAVRLLKMDLSTAASVDTSRELPLPPSPLKLKASPSPSSPSSLAALKPPVPPAARNATPSQLLRHPTADLVALNRALSPTWEKEGAGGAVRRTQSMGNPGVEAAVAAAQEVKAGGGSMRPSPFSDVASHKDQQ